MKTFKKSLLAASVILASGSALAAGETATFVETELQGCDEKCPTLSFEGIQTGADTFEHTGLKVSFDGDADGADAVDRIVITLNGAEFSLSADSGTTATATLDPDGAAADITDARQLLSLNSLVLDVDNTGSVDLSGGTSTEVVAVSGLVIRTDGLDLGDVVSATITAQSDVNGEYVDVSSFTGNIVEVASQLSFERIASFKEIDAGDRLEFVTGDELEATVGGTIVDAPTNFEAATAQTDATFTLTGDFAFVDADGDGVLNDGVTVTGGDFNEDFSQLVAEDVDTSGIEGTIDGNDNEVTQEFTFVFDGETAIPNLSGSIAAEFDYGIAAAGAETFTSSLPALGWSLEGTTATFSYMPYGDNISQILYVTNNSSNDADINVEAVDSEGNEYSGKLDIQATANGAVTKVTGPVMDALMADGFSGNGPLKLSISVNAGDVDFYGAYNVGGSDRGYVQAEVK